MCRVLGVSRSGFYGWRRRAPGDFVRVQRMGLIRRIHRAKRGALGSRRMATALQRRGHAVGRYQARSLMREAGVECRQRRRFKVTTDSAHDRPVAPNLLNRRFDVQQPNTVWCADITAIWTHGGWLYLAAVIDLYNRAVVGWATAAQMRTELASEALEMAVGRCRPGPGLIHHSDRGSQYAAHAYQEQLRRHGIVASMSRKGDCWDNAVMERFFGTLKSEWTAHQHYASREEARSDVITFIEMEYNSDRDHSTLGYATPREVQMAAVA